MTHASPPLLKLRKRIWIASDPHLFHANILKFTKEDGTPVRPGFADVSEMNAHILEKWNAKVKPGDIGYWLGDMTFGDKSQFTRLWPKFNGSKRLVLGNHDDVLFLSTGGFFKKVATERKFGEYGIFLSHRPVHESGLELNGQTLLNVHGHLHEKASPAGPFFNVCPEVIGYDPIEIEELIAHRETLFGPWKDKTGAVRQRSAS